MTDNMMNRDIDEVPVVDSMGIVKVEVEQLVFLPCGSPLILFNHDNDCQQPFFVNWRVQQLLYLAYRQRSIFPGKFSDFRNTNTDKTVTLTIFTLARLKKSTGMGCNLIVGKLMHLC